MHNAHLHYKEIVFLKIFVLLIDCRRGGWGPWVGDPADLLPAALRPPGQDLPEGARRDQEPIQHYMKNEEKNRIYERN